MAVQRGGCLTALLRIFGLGPAPAAPPPGMSYPPGAFPDPTAQGPTAPLQSPAFSEPAPPSSPLIRHPEPAYPYRLRDDVLSRAEGSFFRVLTIALAGRWIICPKVGLRDLFFVPNTRDYTPINKIDRKHVDFVLLDLTTLRPVLAIELDDQSHRRPDRMERDQFVEQVFRTAGLTLLRIPVQRSYQVEVLRQQIEQAVLSPSGRMTPAQIPFSSPAAQPTTTPSFDSPPLVPIQPTVSPVMEPPAPLCPKCGIPLVVRMVRQGANAGTRFYGCSNYPQCREMQPYH